jgi:hypothetical protein
MVPKNFVFRWNFGKASAFSSGKVRQTAAFFSVEL